MDSPFAPEWAHTLFEQGRRIEEKLDILIAALGEEEQESAIVRHGLESGSIGPDVFRSL